MFKFRSRDSGRYARFAARCHQHTVNLDAGYAKRRLKKFFFKKHLSNVVLDFQHKKKMRATFECPAPVKNPAKVNDFTEDDLK